MTRKTIWDRASNLPEREPKMKTKQTPWGTLTLPMTDKDKFLDKVDSLSADSRKKVGLKTTQDTEQLGVETAGDEVEADQSQPQAQTPTASEGNKAVDTNGKPVVVYRGASHGLGVMSFRGAMFFTDNKRVAESYVRGGKLHTATLYMANPAITDANGGEWGNVVPNGSKTQYVVDVLERQWPGEENPELFELINNTIYESYEEAEKLPRSGNDKAFKILVLLCKVG